jgi:DNA-binding NarL/FixJ family response regulator
MRILIADDHEIVREGLTRLIDKQTDMEVVGYADNGLDAFFKTKSLEPDVVIIDTGLPVLSGLDAIPLIHEAAPNTKIIIFSLNKNDEYIHKSFMAGAIGYVLKLSPSKDILDSIRAAERGERYVSPVINKRIHERYILNKNFTVQECPYNLLNSKEQQIFRLLAEGYSSEEIADKMAFSDTMIDQTIKTIADKIRIHDTREMVKFAEEIGVITPECWCD